MISAQSNADLFTRKLLVEKFQRIRATTEKLFQPLTEEDSMISATADTSPPKWHLAHTTWFFEFFILRQQERDFPTFNPTYNYLFNSYYKLLGTHLTKKDRSLLSRPSLEEIFRYRNYVDQKIIQLIQNCDDDSFHDFFPTLEIGLNHEQQHQELLLMDVKQNFFLNPTYPPYLDRSLAEPEGASNQLKKANPHSVTSWTSFDGGLIEIGHAGKSFHYDNEKGRHKVWTYPFQLANQLVTNREYFEFMQNGGYEKPEHWLSDGWDTIQSQGWKAPLYWVQTSDSWKLMQLNGLKDMEWDEPVSHVSYYEAQAFAHFRKSRLPTEGEWEFAAQGTTMQGGFLESEQLHPQARGAVDSLSEMHGVLWQWTQSAYLPYPGYVPFGDSLGEYNSKFMCNQFVLRGGSCVTPVEHYRPTYRNFYYPHMRWQFSGIRLARDGASS